MKVEIFISLSLLATFKNFAEVLASAKSVQNVSEVRNIETISDCDQFDDCSSTEEEEDEGRKRKGGGSGGNQNHNVLHVGNGGPQGSIGGFGVEEYYEVEEEPYKHRKRGRGKGKKKGNKKMKKTFKKMAPIMFGLGGMKLLLYHLVMKKMAFFTFLSFVLSKISFILASLVALKQFFHTPTQHRASDSSKLEVVHIPIRKLRQNKQKEKDSYYDESQFIPVTFQPETTPFYYDFPYAKHRPETFTSSEEDFDSNLDGKFNENLNVNEIYNEHFNTDFSDKSSSSLDRSDTHNQKSYYKNHVHSPFLR